MHQAQLVNSAWPEKMKNKQNPSQITFQGQHNGVLTRDSRLRKDILNLRVSEIKKIQREQYT